MKKNKFLSLRREKIRKLVLMHFLTFLLLLILLPGMAITQAQNKISIEMRNASLQDVFTALQQQRHLRFLYSNEDVDNIKVEQLKSEQEKIGKITAEIARAKAEAIKIVGYPLGCPVYTRATVSGPVFAETTPPSSNTSSGGLPKALRQAFSRSAACGMLVWPII